MNSGTSPDVRTLDAARLTSVVDAFLALQWPVSRTQATELATAIGWEPLASDDDQFFEAETGAELNTSLAAFLFEGAELMQVLFEVADVVADETP